MSALTSGAFGALRHRNYRLYWFGFLVSNSGMWIQMVAQAWLVYDLSGKASWLGAIGAVRALPIIILSLVGGTVADRFDNRKILYVTQSILTLSALTLGILTYTGVVQIWHVLALSMLNAIATAFDNPTRQSLVPRLVPREHLHTAIVLNAIAFNGASIFGAALTGLLVPVVGLAGCFFLNALSFSAVFLALKEIDFPEAGASRRSGSMLSDLVEGLRYILRNPVILALISMAAVNSFFARPYQQFLTVFAKDVLRGDVGLAGIMQSVPSVGTVIFMLTIASLRDFRRKGLLLVGAGLGFTASMIAFAWSKNLYLSLMLLVIVGGCNMTWQTTLNTLLQTNVNDEMRGRVMSAYTITALAMMPLGQGPMGISMDRLGPERALTLGAGISLLWILYMAFVRVRSVRALP